jgi:hypothetical protein
VGRLKVTAMALFSARFERVFDSGGAVTLNVTERPSPEPSGPHPRVISGRKSSSRVATMISTQIHARM